MMLCLACFGLLSVQSAVAQACRASNSSLSGSYGFVASEAGTIAAATGTETTSTTASVYSKTQVGSLLGGIAAGNQFGLTGVLNFDGAGNIDASSSSLGGQVQPVGIYNVNSDCSISLSLTDPFGTSTTATRLAGVVVGRGSEIDLTSVANIQAQTMTGTSTSTASTLSTGPVSTGTGLTVKLVPVLYHNGCIAANINGVYGFVLNPIAVQAPTVSTGVAGTGTTASLPSSLIGYLDFDGAGNIVAVPSAQNYLSRSQTTYSNLGFTGTYTVNPDCSGAMTISSSSTATGTTTTSGTSTSAQALTINFVISPPTVTVEPGSTNTNGSSGGPDLNLSFANSNEAGWGYALPQ
jgi:hypothetical protein